MPAKLADIMRAAAALGVSCSKPKSGSHWKFRNGETVYPVPAHNGEKSEISDVYIRALCRAFKLDEKKFRKNL